MTAYLLEGRLAAFKECLPAPHPFPSPDYCSASFTRQIYFFSFFPQCGVRSQATCSCSFPTICVRLDNKPEVAGSPTFRSQWACMSQKPLELCWREICFLVQPPMPDMLRGRGLTKCDPLVFHVGGWIKN